MLARLAAREVADVLRRRSEGSRPLLVLVRTPLYRGSQGVAAALVRALDPGFVERGFPVADILAGFLRRLRKEQRPAVVVLDDLTPGGPDLSRILRALTEPDRFLPEGGEGVPSVAVALAGVPEGVASSLRGEPENSMRESWVRLLPYDREQLSAIVRDRAERALGRPPPEDWIPRWVERALRDGRGAARAMELMRRQILGPDAVGPGSVFLPRGSASGFEVESRLLAAFDDLEPERSMTIAAIREREQNYARKEGVPALPATTMWRRLVRLERAGLVRRAIRIGGTGGSRSRIELVHPVREWPVVTGPGRTPPVVGPSIERASSWIAARPVGSSVEPVRQSAPAGLPRAPPGGGAA